MARADDKPASDGAAQRLLKSIADHPEISSATLLRSGETYARIEAIVRVPMAQRFVVSGGTPEGVRPTEILWLDFYGPVLGHSVPGISLRADFPTHLAHIQPWKGPEGRVVPCYLYGDPDELLHARGLGAVLDQIVCWLEDAAEGKLIDPKQGWEPTRRDGVYDDFIADQDWLAGQVKQKSGYGLFGLRFFGLETDRGDSVQGSVDPTRMPFTAKAYEGLRCWRDDNFFGGNGLCLVIWGSAQDGPASVYRPEWVQTFAELKSRAAEFHCLVELEDAIRRLERARATFKATYQDQDDPRIPLAVVFMARRPYPIIGSTHAIEIMPYWMSLGHQAIAPFGNQTPVRPLNHRQVASRPLLRRLSGLEEDTPRPEWILIGAGSLGSKIGIHLARRGDGPKVVIDKSRLTPHNMARHALLPKNATPTEFLEGAKAEALAKAIAALAQHCSALERDIRRVIADKKPPWRRRDRALVNTTASLAVRNSLCRTSVKGLPRVIEAALFADGRFGVLAIEAQDRSVLATDLFETLRLEASKDAALHQMLFEDGDGLAPVTIGQGCGSITMAAPDTAISIISAAMAEDVAGFLQESTTRAPKLILYDCSKPKAGLTRREVTQLPVLDLADNQTMDWSFRLHPGAARFIDEDITRWPGVETGGVLIGRRCDFTQCVHIVEALPAPPDSERSAARFVLGVEGRTAAITARTQALGPNYVAIGTWHNHLIDSQPSPTDLSTAQTLAESSGVAPVCIIRSPDSWRVFSSSNTF